MKSTQLGLVIGALVGGCGGELPAQCPPAGLASVTAQSSVAKASPATPPAAVPYQSVASLPAHPAKAWLLLISGSEPNGKGGPVIKGTTSFRHAYQVAENRAGEVPMPATSPWRCRFGPAAVVYANRTSPYTQSPIQASLQAALDAVEHGAPAADANNSFVTRDLACSNDGWKTYVEATASYCFASCTVEENLVDLTLPVELRDATQAGVLVRLAAHRRLDESDAPELP
jgi:hypothetical protein